MSIPPTIQVRKATLADARALADLGRRTFSDTFAADNDPQDMQAYLDTAFAPDQMHRELSAPDALFLVAEIDQQLIGYAKMDSKPAPACVTFSKPGYLSRLYVDHQWLGHRVGKTLMHHCLVSAKTQGYESLWLGVWEENERAIAFYRKWGFEEVGTTTFVLGDDVQTDLVMARIVG